MIYLLDTDTLIYWLKGYKKIEEKIISEGLENITTTIISKAELYFGAYNSKFQTENLNAIKTLSDKLWILDFNDKSALIFGKLKAELKSQGKILLDFDIMISSIAIAYNLILVTNNTKHYARIPDLRIENWIQ